MDKIFWIDKYDKKYKSSDVSDRHLLNIINYITKGGGYLFFLNHQVIDDIYDEAIIRGLKPKHRRSELKDKYDERMSEYEYALLESVNQEHWHGQF